MRAMLYTYEDLNVQEKHVESLTEYQLMMLPLAPRWACEARKACGGVWYFESWDDAQIWDDAN